MKTKKTTFGELKRGDKLVGSDGKTTTVTKVYDKHIPKKMYLIEMEDGEVIKASGNHLWYCETDLDVAEKEMYRSLAKEYFENNRIPDKLEKDKEYPLEIMVNLFGESIKTIVFIENACKSLGYVSMTPHALITDKMKKVNVTEIYNYSYNNLIDFLVKMKEAIINNKGYFYFGKVRTTEEIAKLKWYNRYVNIPHKGEM